MLQLHTYIVTLLNLCLNSSIGRLSHWDDVNCIVQEITSKSRDMIRFFNAESWLKIRDWLIVSEIVYFKYRMIHY